jgi:long-chain acyl-CoA synthetase
VATAPGTRNSLLEYFEEFQRHAHDCAYVHRRGYRTERWSYAKISETAHQFALELQSRQIRKGDKIVIWGENCAEWVAAFWGCVLKGAVVVPMDNAAAPDFALRVHDQVKAKLLLYGREHAKHAVDRNSIIVEDLSSLVGKHSPAPIAGAELSRNDPIEIVFTSGTTAEPKGVVITHGNVLANVAPLETQIRKYLKYERFVHPVRFLNLLPLSHVFGQFLGIFLPPLMGGTVLFQESLNPTEVMATIRRERVSVLVAVPRMLQSLREKILRDLEASGRLEKFWRRFRQAEGKHFLRRWWMFRDIRGKFGWKFWAFICGGAALDRETEEFWFRLGYAAIQGYGLTETSSLISVNHPFHMGRGSIGKILPGREITLAQDGEILVRGGGIATAYWAGQELQPVAGEEGWFQTGDLGEIDAEGNLYFKGRKKDVIVTPAGMNIYPEDLEATLRRQPAVRDCVVIGMERDGNAEPCAVLILRDHDAEPEAIVRRANEDLADYQRMHCWYLWPEEDFPRTSTQKPRSNVIREVVQTGANSRSGARYASALSELISRISGRNPSELRQGANLESDLNLTSLERVELLGALEDRYQVDLSETRFSAVNTVGDLEQLLRSQAPRSVQYHYPYWVLRWPITWIRLLAYYLLMRPAMLLLGWPRVVGRENLRGVRGPVLVISNHVDDIDPGFILTALPAHLRHRLATATGGEALEALRTPPPSRGWLGRIYDRVRWVLGVSLLNLFPLPRTAGFRKSFAYAGEAVDRGYSILVFPEGHHTTDGTLRPFRAGIGLLAKDLGIPVVPMRIDGLFEIKKGGRRFAAPGEIRVHIGAPRRFDPSSDAERIARELQDAVLRL